MKYFGGKLPTDSEESRQVWARKIHNCAESSGITACMWIQVCIGHSGVYTGHYGDVKGRLFVSYKSYLVLLKYMIGKTYIIFFFFFFIDFFIQVYKSN